LDFGQREATLENMKKAEALFKEIELIIGLTRQRRFWTKQAAPQRRHKQDFSPCPGNNNPGLNSLKKA